MESTGAVDDESKVESTGAVENKKRRRGSMRKRRGAHNDMASTVAVVQA